MKNYSSKEIDIATKNIRERLENATSDSEKVRVKKSDYDTIFNNDISPKVRNMSDEELCSDLEKKKKKYNMNLEQLDNLSMEDFDKLLGIE
jgi:hypothetical protein